MSRLVGRATGTGRVGCHSIATVAVVVFFAAAAIIIASAVMSGETKPLPFFFILCECVLQSPVCATVSRTILRFSFANC